MAGLGDAVTIVFELLFEFSVVLQAAPKTANANNVKKTVAGRISVPPMCNTSSNALGGDNLLASRNSSIDCALACSLNSGDLNSLAGYAPCHRHLLPGKLPI